MELENAIAKAAAAGNKVELRKLRKELSDTRKQIREIETSTMQVERVMARLDKASPKELQSWTIWSVAVLRGTNTSGKSVP